MLVTRNLGDAVNTTAQATFNIGELEDVFVTVDGTFTATATVEGSFDNGATWDVLGSTTAALKYINVPGCPLVRGKCSAYTSGTVKFRLAGSKTRDNSRTLVREARSGKFDDIAAANAVPLTNNRAYVADMKDTKVTLISANFVGTYTVLVSADGGQSWGVHTSKVVASGATLDTVSLPRCTHVAVAVSAYTSGTLSSRWAACKENPL